MLLDCIHWTASLHTTALRLVFPVEGKTLGFCPQRERWLGSLFILFDDYVFSASVDCGKDAVDEFGSYRIQGRHLGFSLSDFTLVVGSQFGVMLHGGTSTVTE